MLAGRRELAGGRGSEPIHSSVSRIRIRERVRWVLVEDEGGMVSVTVRDDGPGIPAGRLAEAASDGRLGVSHAISGRIRDLGGSATISSAPGAGTEVRLRVPRAKQMA